MKFRPSIFSLILLLLSSYVFSNIGQAQSVWDVMRSQFRLNHEVTQPEVQTQLRWLISHPSYLNKLARSEPYIYHIVTEIKKRGMPGEIALIPMIESAYDPFAYSGAGAAGLWQLMPGTGNNLGLKQDWWFDARRSIRPSTDAALNYLTYLNKYFNGNWILAIAAYDSGEGTIARAIKNSRQSRSIRFWSLPVPNETRAYVPRLLALAEIIKYPQRYRITLPDIPHVPYFEEVNIGSQIDLNHAARLAGMSYKDLIKLNPGYNRWATAPYKPFKLLIPKDKVAKFNRNLASVPEDKRVSWSRYQVRPGDDLNSIARRNFTTVNLLRELNRLKSDRLRPGQYVLIPSTKNAPVTAKKPTMLALADQPATTQSLKVLHIVQRSDTYQTLEKKYNVSTAEIRKWNNLNSSQSLKPGQQLTIWKKTVKYGVYIVKAGDNLSSIAKRNHTKVATLARLNPDINKRLLHPGQKLVIG
ncbi:membrane bound lytic murein transglycosylase D [Legionella lansingensis]|uniref:Membrane bound lytic murein transglycosylase D n=1 Tax=Legionella lansingensis TaxID=45067 RepID=A0A0W0VTE5_9GAMM|nr:membrane bound lytic murein transglycosylase D [Legionella lansingensis]SNV49584.1 membrane bound lytic murein transglycosylase D [Legionella lansingensis]